jgi:hypothetical protein
MQAIKRALVAVFAQSHAKVLPMLFDVVCVAWASLIAYRTGQLLHAPNVFAFFRCKLIVHRFLFVKPIRFFNSEQVAQRHIFLLLLV